VDWTHTADERQQLCGLVNMMMNLWVPGKAESLVSRMTVSCSWDELLVTNVEQPTSYLPRQKIPAPPPPPWCKIP
jgi:hypothetical protein